jgi:hypothetical protein
VGGGDIKKGCRKVNMMEILFTRACKWKMIPVETVPAMGAGR